ncbi:hypothetical protein [Commensalibacter papalotli (ex Botero et al. 2024)]|uniref:Uncharacterized protein n=1 Tax=Commensalibacter papalotli (ex Botero et al. 2024) TaxID=2972766 RepID=A0ABN8W324_9PROT|nr:hypothetical protein [Commensalibacter papalotli (ex Botero et al. 2024)]CAI3923253.1 unnamed protein product [Commensalibacter papalotli (ex Botero et al. 2024)]CAI3928761.1 unnamed protein product [Commensalibacter papalotli (ex Botero et al. 2024)]
MRICPRIKKRILQASGNPQQEAMEALKNLRLFKTTIKTLDVIGKYTLYVSCYNIITADDKIAATERELMSYGAGAVGMYAGGFVGRVICGPFCAYGGGLIGSFLAIYLMDSYIKL